MALLGCNASIITISVFLYLGLCAHLSKVVLSVLNRCGCFSILSLSKVDAPITFLIPLTFWLSEAIRLIPRKDWKIGRIGVC